MRASQLIMSRGDLFVSPVTLVESSHPQQPLIYANKHFQQITGYEEQEVLGKNCRFLQGPETDREATGWIRDAILARRPICQDLLNYTKRGEKFYNRLVLIPFQEYNEFFFVGFQHTISKENFKPRHLSDGNELLDKTINPLAVMVALFKSNPNDLQSELNKAAWRISHYVLSL